MRIYKTEGIIIKRTNFSEADRILTIFSKQLGKIKVIAKGVRKITSRRGGNIELLNVAEITLHQGHNFDILTEASVVKSYPQIKNDLVKIGYAYFVCELIDGLCAEHVENHRIYLKLMQVLDGMTKAGLETMEQWNNEAMYDFKLFLLRDLGFWPPERSLPSEDIDGILEEILEKNLKSKRFLQKIKQ